MISREDVEELMKRAVTGRPLMFYLAGQESPIEAEDPERIQWLGDNPIVPCGAETYLVNLDQVAAVGYYPWPAPGPTD